MSRPFLMAFALAFSALILQDNQSTVDKIAAAKTAPRISAVHALTASDQKAVIQAVEDEVYDYGFGKEFYEIGINSGTPHHWISKVPIYIEPGTDKDGNGRAIYRLMPYGEVFRLFFIRKDGIVVLIGDPDNKFPITQPSKLTVFMDDDEICRMKRQWIRSSIFVDEQPSSETVDAAASRQEIRTGFSASKTKHATGKQ
jgi:hypothetical protein